MPEYIEREALLKEFNECFPSLSFFSERDISLIAVKARIETIPAADAVEVVRCKDCQFFKRDTDYCKKRNKGYCYWDNTIKTKTHFCSYGERKEGAEE